MRTGFTHKAIARAAIFLGFLIFLNAAPTSAFTLSSGEEGQIVHSSFYQEIGDDEHAGRRQDLRKRRDAVRDELMSLPPEERRARMEDIRRRVESERAEQREGYRQAFQERWAQSSPEERARFCDHARTHCREAVPERRISCSYAGDVCEGIEVAGEGSEGGLNDWLYEQDAQDQQ